MLITLDQRPYISHRASHFTLCSLLMLLTLTLLSGTLAAQTGQEETRAAAQRLRNEGVQLFQQGTKESLEAAIRKFSEALPLYRSLNDRSDEALMLVGLGSSYRSLGEMTWSNLSRRDPLAKIKR